MELGHDRATKQSSKEEQWQQRLAWFAASVQRVKQFCQAEAVSAASFYRWSKLLAKVARPHAPGFIDVGPMAPAPRTAIKAGPASAALEVRLKLGQGLVLHIVSR
ncbi:MAG: hypothetical protein V4754_10180 [Pseudomonadota bacterium]